MSDISSETKKALIPYFGREYVSVKRGRGTAWGWIHANVRIPRPADCKCKQLAEERKFNGFSKHCTACKETITLSERVIDAAVKNIQFNKYADDMGYGDHSEFLAQVNFDSEER
jgi:hypothetical protein